jgi:Rad3-related DNA helicase
MTTREKLHRLVDELPEEKLDAALEAIESRADDPLIRRLEDAPPEDEEISAEEEAAVQEARDELAAGTPLISHDEIKREFGIE